jgi:SPP1 gp7 family putative phage head morphogenesis protein
MANLLDRKKRRENWLLARLAEKQYSRNLLSVARQIQALITGHAPDGTVKDTQSLIYSLYKYAELIEPWASAVAGYMLADVSRRNEKAWRQHGADIGRELRHVIKDTPVGIEMRSMLKENVKLIKSLPTKAAENVHAMVQEGIVKGTRSTTIAKEILESSSVPVWRAKLIARTEVSRAAVTLTQARAQAIGSQGYIWRTVGDADVRPDHKAMEGVYVPWGKPPSFSHEPTLGPYHAGAGPNCRCFPSPIFPKF